MDDIRILEPDGLDGLIAELRRRGYRVVGPSVRGDAIVTGDIHAAADLPKGVGDEQEAGTYRLRQRDDDAYFGFADPAQSTKPVFFPAEEVVWRGRREEGHFTVERDTPDAPPIALLGVRSCDLRAVEIHDAVLADRPFHDAHYIARRDGTFTVAVACGEPAATCFCASMGTGPRPAATNPETQEPAYDLLLTEVMVPEHRFVLEVGTEAGREVADAIATTPAGEEAQQAAIDVTDQAAARQTRSINTDTIHDVLQASAESPRWDDVASRCLACTNCTLVCPTCFCTTIQDTSDLAGDNAERHRVWDSCFSENFSYIHGGPLRGDVKARYRQWITHKLSSWEDQFGMLGCVGCGRCIAWCPVGIDITEEAAALGRMATAASST
ncbi:4Fe-4S dicluster domain-containing protein [Demequina sp. SYSU T00192]|uniref:4Fe-4S dicluster domain-containing protein n=1 Tax=Demequina litoralis TaxID=3051660 RepID=A0ABT8G9H9_9MICO|nr:4Fe-4S dicluster domain-containing protein [Demequina sp. SYSU T00192]MDN4475798.1 4Fe-4S dicluster domain-containing protein [Demequina sp. SYSU T00192]